MSKAADILESLPSQARSALNEIAQGMELKKCRKCGCMKDALDQAIRAFDSSEAPEIRALVPRIFRYRTRMEPLAYDCIGCKKCWGADATIALANHFEGVEPEACGTDDQDLCGGSKSASRSAGPSWPPYPGDYVSGNPAGTVAVCTLSNRDLPLRLIAEPAVAIAGRCDTENIGVEKVVLNLLANSRIRWLVICGHEAKGHRAGDAFLRLKERGVDADMRVLGAHRILKKLSGRSMEKPPCALNRARVVAVATALRCWKRLVNRSLLTSTTRHRKTNCRKQPSKLLLVAATPLRLPNCNRLKPCSIWARGAVLMCCCPLAVLAPQGRRMVRYEPYST